MASQKKRIKWNIWIGRLLIMSNWIQNWKMDHEWLNLSKQFQNWNPWLIKSVFFFFSFYCWFVVLCLMCFFVFRYWGGDGDGSAWIWIQKKKIESENSRLTAYLLTATEELEQIRGQNVEAVIEDKVFIFWFTLCVFSPRIFYFSCVMNLFFQVRKNKIDQRIEDKSFERDGRTSNREQDG